MGKKTYSATATKEQMNLVAKSLNDVMNDIVELDGIPADTVILSSLVVIGATVRSRGVILDMEAKISEGLPPFAKGYLDQSRKEQNG